MTILLFYMIGMVFALSIGWREMRIEEKAGYDTHDAPAGLLIIALISWLYVILCMQRYIYYRENELLDN